MRTITKTIEEAKRDLREWSDYIQTMTENHPLMRVIPFNERYGYEIILFEDGGFEFRDTKVEEPRLRAIVAVNKMGYIGLNGSLPWKSKDDLHHFKELTMGSTLIVGYNTAQTLPKLSGRNIVVYDKNKGVDQFSSDVWCIGGKNTYESLCHLFTELHISVIDDYTIGDTKFPNLDNLNPECKTYYYNFNTSQ